MPSTYVLKMGLSYCLDWLKREYWIPQDKDIADSEVAIEQEDKYDDDNVMLLNIYNDVVQESHKKAKVFKELSRPTQDLLMSVSNKISVLSIGQILGDLAAMIVQRLDSNDWIFFQNLAELIISASNFTKPDSG